MPSLSALALASLLSLSVAAPLNERDAADECPVATSSCTVITTTVLATNVDSVMATMAAATMTVNAVDGSNVQLFTGTLGGAPPPVISSAGDRPFSVNGNTFVGSSAALGRSCDVQHNACANAANSGSLEGGVGQCDDQNNQCHQANSLRKRALDLGSCSDPTILFEEGLDGRNEAAFIAANQDDFNHGSALKIGVIAGFICQRLGSSCKAPDDVQATCSSASAAAVATTQDQAAADAFNAIIGGGAAVVDATSAAAADAAPVETAAAECAVASATTPEAASQAAQAVVMTITSCA